MYTCMSASTAAPPELALLSAVPLPSPNLAKPTSDEEHDDLPGGGSGSGSSSRRNEEEHIDALVHILSTEAARGVPAKKLQDRVKKGVVDVFCRGGFRPLVLSLIGWVALGAFTVRTARRA